LGLDGLTVTIGREAETETDTILHAGAEEIICGSNVKTNCSIAMSIHADPRTFDDQENSKLYKHYSREINILSNSNLADDCCNSIKDL